MARRGRPKKSSCLGAKRWLYALSEYDNARASGQKYSVALNTAATRILAKYPHLKICRTEIKRMLAQLRPLGKVMVLVCTEINPEKNTAVMPDGTRLRFSLRVRVGECPVYPRHNAAT
jgi:hypothetical protein